MEISRRSFTRRLALGTSAALLSASPEAWSRRRSAVSPSQDEDFWSGVREQFILDPGLAVMNAANLCPASRPVLEVLEKNTHDVDRDPSFDNRAKLTAGKEATRRTLAAFLGVTPEEIVITRNTSESNNLVSNGVDLKAGDEVVIFSDNHPSNYKAWIEKSKRFGFTVRVIDQPNPHPGPDFYVESVTRELNSRTRVLGFSHLTNTMGDLLPAREMCRIARERGVLTLVDGAQSFGLMEVDLNDMQPDFYSGSAHKWPCGPKETGVLFVNKAAQSRIWPTVYSAYPGAVGVSRTLETMGQRDEPAMIAFGEALSLQTRIGRRKVEARSRELAQSLMDGLRKIDGIRLYTHQSPERSVAVVTFMPGNLDVGKLSKALYERDRIACATRGGDHPGLRFSPHIYNSHREVERVLEALKRYMSSGV